MRNSWAWSILLWREERSYLVSDCRRLPISASRAFPDSNLDRGGLSSSLCHCSLGLTDHASHSGFVSWHLARLHLLAMPTLMHVNLKKLDVQLHPTNFISMINGNLRQQRFGHPMRTGSSRQFRQSEDRQIWQAISGGSCSDWSNTGQIYDFRW